MNNYSALIVDSNREHRARLKTVMRATPYFPSVYYANSLEEAEQCLIEHRIDIVFLALRSGGRLVNEFINRLKTKAAGRDAAYVVLLEGRRSSLEVVKNIVDGADALLLEPYSVDSLFTITTLAESVKRDRAQLRIRAAMHLLVQEIAAQVGQLAKLEKTGAHAAISRGMLHEMCAVLRELDPEMTRIYWDVVLDVFPALHGRSPITASTYRGVSQRIRKNCSTRALQTVKTALAA